LYPNKKYKTIEVPIIPNLDKPPNSCTTGQAEPNRWSCKTYGVFLFWFVQVRYLISDILPKNGRIL